MMEIEDIHTHRTDPEWGALINLRFSLTGKERLAEIMDDDRMYSVGVHPWDAGCDTDAGFWDMFETLVSGSNVAAIGECGVDLKNTQTPLFRQLQIFKRQMEISEKLRIPIIIHDVKADDIICGLRRDLKPGQPWAIHGFRGKPAAAAMLLKSGCYISFGEKFNPDTLKTVPPDRILAETDESTLTIQEIISNLASVRGESIDELTSIIKANLKKFCNFGG